MRETVVYRDVEYHRYPKAGNWSDRVYYKRARWRKDLYSNRYLHRQIWMDNYGNIPDGYQIHHIDGDASNNNIYNLECVDSRIHAEQHFNSLPEWKREWLKEHIIKISKDTNVKKKIEYWRTTPEGKKSLRDRGVASWVGRKSKEYTCQYCGSRYLTRQSNPKAIKFCSGKCAQSSYRKDGRFKVVKVCTVCNNEFKTSKYKPAKTCSPKCRNIMVSNQ